MAHCSTRCQAGLLCTAPHNPATVLLHTVLIHSSYSTCNIRHSESIRAHQHRPSYCFHIKPGFTGFAFGIRSADAKEAKIKAKLNSCHIVAKSMKKVAEINLKYGGQAALAVGNAALNDISHFVPFLSPLAPKILPDLVHGFAAGPQGIQNALGGLASAIGGALVGEYFC